MLVSLCSPAHPRHGQPSAHQGLPVLSCCHLQKKPKGLWRNRAELACPRSWLLSQATAAVPQAPPASAAPVSHTASHQLMEENAANSACASCILGTLLSHTWMGAGPGPPALCLCHQRGAPAPTSSAGTAGAQHHSCEGITWFYQELAFSPPLSGALSHQGPKSPAMALLMWDAAGLMRGLPGSRDTGKSGLRWDCHMHWLWNDCTMSL